MASFRWQQWIEAGLWLLVALVGTLSIQATRAFHWPEKVAQVGEILSALTTLLAARAMLVIMMRCRGILECNLALASLLLVTALCAATYWWPTSLFLTMLGILAFIGAAGLFLLAGLLARSQATMTHSLGALLCAVALSGPAC